MGNYFNKTMHFIGLSHWEPINLSAFILLLTCYHWGIEQQCHGPHLCHILCLWW